MPTEAGPAATVTPPADDVPCPVARETSPLAPLVAGPEPRYTAPVEPEAVEAPVLSTTLPLLELVAAVCSDSKPLPPAPDPVITYTEPPTAEAAEAVPAEMVTAPPVPEVPVPTDREMAPPAPPLAVPVLSAIVPEALLKVVPVPR